MAMNPRIVDWQGRRVWLLGASSGIGAAFARALAARGARLALSARNREKLRELGLEGALILPADATDAASLQAARRELQAAWGGFDLVVYLAGDYLPMGAEDFDLATAERLLDVNYRGAMRLAASVLRELEAGGGIAFVASVAGYRGLPRAIAYGPGKAALIHFAECLWYDLHPQGVGVWIVNPGFVATRLTDRNDFSMPALQTPEQAAAAMVEGFAAGRFEIHFPRRFTRLMKCIAHLPYRCSLPLVRRFTGG